ncbi:hypothetical protein GCM10020255_018500 [Rhodococcus baikonurensis]
MDIAIILTYLAAMLAFGWWGKRRASNSSEYLVAGRRLGGVLYTSTMAAVVIGGASTVGGVGLGYKYGISGMWLVVSIAAGVLLLSLLFASRIQRLKVYTVSGMLKLRYGIDATGASGIVMMAYTLMLTVTSTIAYATIFNVLFGFDRTLSVVLGGLIVVAYSAMGGMWSITLTDVVQFVIKTIGIFFLLLPFTWSKAGGYDGIKERVGDAAFSLGTIGTGTIITFFVVYTLGILIGQDIWQRVFTAKSPEVARWGGVAAGVYCLLYGVAGALIGLAASALMPDIGSSDDVYADVAVHVLPIGLSGIVLAAAVAAMMSTASGALIATATVARQDVLPLVSKIFGRTQPGLDTSDPEAERKPSVRHRDRPRQYRPRRPDQRHRRGAHDCVRHPRGRPARPDPRWSGVEEGHRNRSDGIDGGGNGSDSDHDVRRRRRAGQRTGVRRSGECTRRLRCAESDHGADSARSHEDLERASFRKGHGDGRTRSRPDSLKVGACRSARHKEVDRAQGR